MFQFKQFTIHQDQCAMKVCTDSCLFGALIDVQSTDEILDIGAGTGLLSLMLAQKGVSKIDAIELDVNASKQASLNISESKFKNQISLYNQSIQDFTKHCNNKYSVIVSNPPFFTNSLKSTNEQKNAAHHSVTLSPDDLMFSINALLNEEGVAWLLLSPYELNGFQKAATDNNLNFYLRYEMYDRMDKYIRTIVCVTGVVKELKSDKIIIYNTDRSYTEEFIRIMKPYYLYL